MPSFCGWHFLIRRCPIPKYFIVADEVVLLTVGVAEVILDGVNPAVLDTLHYLDWTDLTLYLSISDFATIYHQLTSHNVISYGTKRD